MSAELELFTLSDKYFLMFMSTLLLVFSVGLFVWFENVDKVKRFQIPSKKMVRSYLLICTTLLFLSFMFLAIPFVEHKTISIEITLNEVLIDNENDLIVQKIIENAYYPTFNGSFISWYTKDVRDKRYLQSKKVIQIDNTQRISIYELYNDSRLLSINDDSERPIEIRGAEVQSFWYSLVFVIYNIVVAIIMLPLFSMHGNNIKLLWKSQNIISILLLSIMISYTFAF